MSENIEIELKAIVRTLNEVREGFQAIAHELFHLAKIAERALEIIDRPAAAPIAAPPPPSIENLIWQALVDHGGPPEIAPQLLALAMSHQLLDQVIPWIRFHTGAIWSASEFNAWCFKLRGAAADLEAVKGKSQ